MLAVCREMQVPLTVRGAGTSIAGNAVGRGVVVDVSRHLNRVLEVDAEARTALVEPGVVQAGLQAGAARHGLRFGPDPSTHKRATLGGMIGNNACGSRALGYGRTSDNVLGLDVVAGTGERLRLGDMAGTPGALSAVLDGLKTVTDAGLATIRTELGRFGRQVGLVRDSPVRVLVALGYPSMADAADAVPAVLPHRPVACEGLDAHIVDVVRTRRGASAVPGLPRGSGWLLVELAGEDTDEVVAAARGWWTTRAHSTRRWSPTPHTPRHCGGSGGTAPGSRGGRWPATRRTRGGRTPPCHRSGSVRTCASSRR